MNLKHEYIKKREKVIITITTLVAMLFFYAAFSKLMDYDKSQWEMQNQVFPKYIANVLTWLVPAVELILMTALLFPTTRINALWGSLMLLTVFTIYIAVVMTGVFGRVPCSCGGILKNMSYGTHLIFNLIFVGLAWLGLAIEKNWKNINRLFNPKNRKELA